MQALVTGGSGFIGSELIRILSTRERMHVRALMRKSSLRQNLEGAQFQPVIGDLQDFESLKEAVKGVDIVFHLAGCIAARTRDEFFRHNAEGTANLARACAEANPGLKRFVYVSSIAASGPARSKAPKREDEPDLPISAYGESKLAGEKELEKWAQKGSFGFTVIRPPAVYGPRDKGIFEFIKLVNVGVVPRLPSSSQDKKKYTSIIHVSDLVDGIILAGTEAKQSQAETFFIAGEGVYAWDELFSVIAEALNKKVRTLPIPLIALTGAAVAYTAAGWALNRVFPFTFDKLRELKQDYWVCSNDRICSTLNFKPKWDLKSGMKQTVDWYRKSGWIA